MVFFGEADRRDLALIVSPEGEPAPAVSIAQISGYTLKLPVESAQQMAQLQQRITAVWDAHYTTASEVGNGLG
ncbi:hypothetical protein JET66_21695 [Pseudomonas putida]|nr:hypothetical protein [Pseudomonas putida]